MKEKSLRGSEEWKLKCAARPAPIARPGLPEPTQASPGSEAKILVLARRYQDNELLHHPLDSRV